MSCLVVEMTGMSVKCTKMKSKARAKPQCLSLFNIQSCGVLVVAVLARFLSFSMSERDRFQRSGTWPSCLSKISRSNMRFTVELKQSALSTPVFCRRPDSQLFHWGNFDVRASLQKHKISPSRLMLAAFLCVIDDDYFVIISSCSLSTTFAKCTKTWQELLERHPLREKNI